MWHDMAEFFASLDVILSQPVRAAVVRRFCHMATQRLKESKNPEAYHDWLTRGRARFIRQCQVKDGLQAVASDLTIKPTQLASFCEDWLKATKYRNQPAATWRPFTLEQNHLRMAMLWQLTVLAQGRETPDLTSCDHVV